MDSSRTTHQYVPLPGTASANETLIADRVIDFLYSTAREQPSVLQRMVASRLATTALAAWEFDLPLRRPVSTIVAIAERMGIDVGEVHGDLRQWRTLRDLFERQIRYWHIRPMTEQTATVVSPADGKALAFGYGDDFMLPVKSKWIAIPELVGSKALADQLPSVCGVIVRLTPEAYHYVHAPVSGVVRSHDLIDGALHSCNPTALVSFANPYAINLRRVTVIDTDVYDGSRIGIVVLVNVAAMMIGRVEDVYCATRYDAPEPISVGSFIRRGQPMALFRPGSSTSIALWSRNRACLLPALAKNAARTDVQSRFSHWLLSPWVESAVRVRSTLASAC